MLLEIKSKLRNISTFSASVTGPSLREMRKWNALWGDPIRHVEKLFPRPMCFDEMLYRELSVQ
jgi:hypothetical protein